MDVFEEKIDHLAKVLKQSWHAATSKTKAYIKRLLFPLYFFPVKLVTYTAYYFVKFLFKLIFAILGLILDVIIYPFRSLKHFLKAIVLTAIGLYLVASLFVIADYMRTQYGHIGKFLCTFNDTKGKLKSSVVRVVGGYSEGSGFFIDQNRILTNFHVIADEPSPKIVLPDGKFETPVKIVGDKNADLAVLTVTGSYPDLILPLPQNELGIYPNEPLLSTGYPLGTEITGDPTTVKGNFIDYRHSKKDPVVYVQTSVSLVEGMSGGPLTDQCGTVVGINTLTLAGQSFYIDAHQAAKMLPGFTDQEIAKITVDPSKSPADAVTAFYTYLKARRMEDGFNLLSTEYLKKTDFQEWTNRFTDILDVEVFKSEQYENSKDTAFVKFATKNWVDNEVEVHYYEGTWQTIQEDGKYKMLKSKIVEVDNPGYTWFYE